MAPSELLLKFFGKKTLINVDGLEWLRPKWKGLGAKYFYWASKMAVKYYDVIINDSEEMRQYYLKEFNVESEVIAYGANIRFSQNPELIKKWHLTPKSYYLVVGRLIPDNNADLICQEFINSKSNKSLVIVGDVPYQDEYANKIKSFRDSRLLFTGYITDQNELAELYHNCYAYLHGHEFGGTNPTLIKGTCIWLCPNSFKYCFNKEVLDGYENGLYFNKVKDDLKYMLEEVEMHPNSLLELQNKSRKRIEANYTWEKIAWQYFELFKLKMNK
jgi:glycosyltransferase involved in cell wall biosynthesis